MSAVVHLPPPSSLEASFGLTDEQDVLRSTVRAALAHHAPLSVTDRFEDDPVVARQRWSTLAELGAAGALVPEAFGGVGLGITEAAILLSEAGRVLLNSPLLATTLAVAVILRHGSRDLAAGVLPAVAAGDSTFGVALLDPSPSPSPSVRAVSEAGAWALYGSRTLVLGADGADRLLVTADTDDGPALFVCAGRAHGVATRPLRTLDVTRRFAAVTFHGASATPVGDPDGGSAATDARDLGIVLSSAEQVGAAQRALEMTVDHARSRVQYRRAIGSFQAVKHRCADMLIDVEYATSVALYAAWAAAVAPEELPALAGVLKTVVAEPFVRVTERMIQIHGGIGFTWDHPAHLFYKRAVSDRVLFATPEVLQDRLADCLGLGPV